MKTKEFFLHLLLQSLTVFLIIPSFYKPQLGILLFVIFIPFYFSLERLVWLDIAFKKKIRFGFILGYICGIILFCASFFWLWNLNVWLAIFAIGFSALYVGFFQLFCIYIKSKQPECPLFILLPSIWVIFEYLRGNFLMAFGGASLGYGLVAYKPFIQIARFLGIYGISFFVLFVNGLFFAAIKKKDKRLVHLNSAILLLGLIFLDGKTVIAKKMSGYPAIKIAIAQGNLAPEIHASFNDRHIVMDTYGALAKEAKDKNAVLIIFPEAVLPADLFDNRAKDILDFYKNLSHRLKIYLVTGARQKSLRPARQGLHNSAYLFNPEGRIADIYNKIKLVPLFEEVAFSEFFPFLKKFHLGKMEFLPGDKFTVFRTEWGKFSTLICFEVLFPHLAQKFVNNGAELLVNISNDIDLGNNLLTHRLNNAMITFRAVENSRYLVKCNATGEGFIVDPHGCILEKIPLGRRGIIISDIFLYSDKTFYNRYGYAFPLLLIIAFVIVLAVWPARKEY
jgi:apolipoprotein N-acyltransferase